MKKIIINGKFLVDRMQGIVRYSRELVLSLDKIINNDDFEFTLLYPSDAKDIPSLKNIKLMELPGKGGIKWEQVQLRKFLRKNKDYVCLNFCNVAPIGVKPGLTTIHDVMYKSHIKGGSLRVALSSLWHRYQYRYLTKHEKVIFTDSEYSKQEIEKYYPKAKGKIEVLYVGYDHVKRYKEDLKWNEKFSFLRSKDFYFSLASLSENKNGKWIIEVAKRNPKATFAIGGQFYNDKSMLEELPENVHLLGFISDDLACSFIKNCKAFIFPSIIEGFGLPPLEALALGANVISSNVSSMPEILGKSVHYINPFEYDIDLDKLLKEKVESPDSVLKKFTFDNSAKKLLEIISNKF